MAKIADPLRAEGKGMVRVVGRFFPAGTGAITYSNNVGWTAARTGVGTYLITFAEKYSCLCSATATVQHTTAVDLVPQFGDFTAATATAGATLVLRLVAVATATDMAANANSSVSFDVQFSTHASPK